MPVKRRKKPVTASPVSQNAMETVPPGTEDLLIVSPQLKDLFAGREVEIRILIVADADLVFTDEDLGLNELIVKSLLPSTPFWNKLIIVKAHRAKGAGADVFNFRFGETPLPSPHTQLEDYDQVWLFGKEGEKESGGSTKPNPFTLKDSEVRVLTNFMNKGGGVFATGDHQDLGAALCGRVPRVRSMRKWFYEGLTFPQRAPGRDDETRIDTLREGHTVGFSLRDQEDDVPQEIRPRLKSNGNKSVSHPLLSKEEPHPSPEGSFIKVLPDHMHEGECVLPTECELKATMPFVDEGPTDEYPKLPGTNIRVAPEVVAISTSAGGYLLPEGFPPVEPRCYNIIVAYNGHCVHWTDDDGELVPVGRVVVDASFHHFVDINLKGKKPLPGDKPTSGRRGFYDEQCNPTKDYLEIKQYYRNIVKWLCPPGVIAHYYVNMLLALRYMPPLNEEILAVETPDWKDVFVAGTFTRNAIIERFSQADATHCALAVAGIQSKELHDLAAQLIDPWCPSDPVIKRFGLIFNFELMTKVLLGGAMLNIARNLSINFGDAYRELKNWDSYEKRMRELVGEGVRMGLEAFSPLLNESSNRLRDFLSNVDVLLG